MAKLRIKPFDVVAFLVAAGVMVGFSAYALVGRGEPSEVFIETDTGQFIYPLAEARVIDVAGPLGDTVVVIEDEHVHVESSPCRDKICIAMGHVSLSGDWIACLPNRVFIRIQGSEEERRVDGQTF